MTTATKTLPTIIIQRPPERDVAEEPTVKMRAPTLEDEIARFERDQGRPLTKKERQRIYEAQPYRRGQLEEIEEAGLIQMQPEGCRVRMRAVLAEDASVMASGKELEYDARKSVAHVIEAVGPGVRRHLDEAGVPDDSREKRSLVRRLQTLLSGRGVQHGARPMPGDHVFVLSTVADRASKTSRAVRVWTVHVDDLSLRWLPKAQ